jgi:signal transduction histidine kinase
MPENFWDHAIIFVYFVYGLAFYSLGLALLVESVRSSELGFARSMRLLAGFGLLHGIHEWIDVYERGSIPYYGVAMPLWMDWVQLALLITSFVALSAFGENLLRRVRGEPRNTWFWTGGLLTFYLLSGFIAQLFYHMDEYSWVQALDVLGRYILGVPSALIACRALWNERADLLKRDMAHFASLLNWAIGSLFLYGVIGQAFPTNTTIFPSMIINGDLFLELFGFPIELVRALLACVIAVALIQVLRALEVENEERLKSLERAQVESERLQNEALSKLNEELRIANEETARLLEEVQQRDALRGELIQRITAAQEAERQRIARELHDETGQVLTGIGLGLRGLAGMAENDPQLAAKRLHEIEKMATSAISGLRLLINDLRPPQLDDMGLLAALRFMAERLTEMYPGIKIDVEMEHVVCAMPPEIQTTMFRIAQEALTNTLKHAQATEIQIMLMCRDCPVMIVRDNGKGFDPQQVLPATTGRTAWGLYGIQERANLINADVTIESAPGNGTTITIRMRDRYCEEVHHAHSYPDR